MEFTESALKERLSSLGYTFPETSSNTDAVLVTYALSRVSDYITNDINQDEIPTKLASYAIDLASAEFLNDKLTFSKGDLEGLDLSGVVSSLSEGDTSVSFKDGYSDAELLKEYITRGYEALKSQLACFRKMRW